MPGNADLYDIIGHGYPATRRTDPRIAARIWEALGDARTVLNVGAGTGSYEPHDRDVTAVEPSAVMRTRPHVRRGTSVWARVGPAAEQRAVSNLRADLASGRWADRNHDIISLDTAELGARLLLT
jgi:hypothetical protein